MAMSDCDHESEAPSSLIASDASEDEEVDERGLEEERDEGCECRVHDLMQRLLHTMLPETVDLISQLCSFGPLLLDGGALLREVASNIYLDWQHGGQFLHAVFLLEKILAHLLEKGPNIEVFFFEDEAILQQGALPRLVWVFLQDYLGQLSRSATRLQMHLLPDIWLCETGAREFQDLVSQVGPCCVLTDFGRHMPALQKARKVQSLHKSEFDFQSAMSCGFVSWLQKQGMQVVNLEGLQASGPHVEAELLKPTMSSAKISEKLMKLLRSQYFSPMIPSTGKQVFEAQESCKHSASNACPSASQRLTVGMFAVRRLIQASQADDTEKMDLHLELTAVLCMTFSIQETLPLQHRYIADSRVIPLPAALQDTVSVFLESWYAALIDALGYYRHRQPNGLDATVGDIFDGRLFHFVAGEISKTSGYEPLKRFPKDAMILACRLWGHQCADQSLESLCMVLGAAASEHATLESHLSPEAQAGGVPCTFPPKVSCEMREKPEPFHETANHLLDLPALHTLLSQSLEAKRLDKCLRETELQGITRRGAQQQREPFRPHHFHSRKPLDEMVPDAYQAKFAAQNVRTLRIDNQSQMKEIVAVLSETGVVSIGRRQRFPDWMRAVKQRDVTFTVKTFTDRTTVALPICGRFALQQQITTCYGFPITLQFSMDVPQSIKDMRLQKLARYQTKFIESLLQGAPVKPQVIPSSNIVNPTLNTSQPQQSVTKLAEGEKTRGKGKKVPDGHRAKDSNSTSSATLQPKRSIDKAREQVAAVQKEKFNQRAMEEVNSWKANPHKLDVAEMADKAKSWWDGGATAAAVKAYQSLLQSTRAIKDAINPTGESCQLFLSVQAALRMAGGPQILTMNGGEEGRKLLHKIQRLATTDLKMPLLASALDRACPSDQTIVKKKKDHSKVMRNAPSDEHECPIRFQLSAVPENLARPAGTTDARVQGFRPDTWQSQLLDVVDAGQSALVLAPTASGKTFISFYVMEKILRTDDDGVVVYVCPTKALANQVHAEIQARFTKDFSHGRVRAVSGIFTRDFRQHAMQCQILVTVPECLLIYLLSPGRETKDWTGHLRHAIVDEVHCLGVGNGSAWEQLLILLKCPILALSATLGNASQFTQWLEALEKSRGRQLHVVQHFKRFNDLQPWLFGDGVLSRLHPFVAATTHQCQYEGTTHIHMTPEDCLKLYDALVKAAKIHTGNDSSSALVEKLGRLSPGEFFADKTDSCWDLSMDDVKSWQLKVCQLFESATPVIRQESLQDACGSAWDTFKGIDKDLQHFGEDDYLKKNIPSLAMELLNKSMLPAICFHNSREGCKRIAHALSLHLERGEKQKMVEEGEDKRIMKIQSRLEELKHWLSRSSLAKYIDQGSDVPIVEGSLEAANLKEMEDLKTKLRLMVAVKREFTMLISGSPPISHGELEEAFQGSRADFDPAANVHHRILLRGIGIHHAGLPKEYRQVVERLFRMRRLGLVVSTSTLALGINMPSKTSIFAGDSVYLDAMQYQQEAGRAGRRGFDLRGHTVFFGLPMRKVQLLIGAKLPELRGNFSLTPSLALRIALCSGHTASQSVMLDSQAAVARLLDNPLFNPSPSQPLVNTNMFAFYIQSMVRRQILNDTLSGTDLAGFVAHIFWDTPGNFMFLELLREMQVLTDISENRDNIVLILCHLFCRRRLPTWMVRMIEYRTTSSPSLILLPSMPDQAATVLAAAASSLLQEVVCNLKHFVEACDAELEQEFELPLSRTKPCPMTSRESDGDDLSCPQGSMANQYPKLRSPFVALSGHGDDFQSIAELCDTSLGCLRLQPDMFPSFDLHESGRCYLNAFLYDFYQHGQTSALIRHNKVPGSELWTRLEDFNLVLRALAAALSHRFTEAALPNEDMASTFEALSQEFEATMKRSDMSRTPL